MEIRNNSLTKLALRANSIQLDSTFYFLPSCYKAYISFYVLGSVEFIFKQIKVYIEDRSEPVTVWWENSVEVKPWIFPDDKLFHMLKIVELIDEITEYKLEPMDYHEKGFIKIGLTRADLILLGVMPENREQIFLYGDSSSYMEFIKIADNIFDMFAKLDLVPYTESLNKYGIDLNTLVLDWGSDVWRSKPSSA